MFFNYEQHKLLLQLSMLDEGIAPIATSPTDNTSIERFDMVTEVKKFLSTLTPEEQLKAKRKFRKLHRKISRKNLDMSNNGLLSKRERQIAANKFWSMMPEFNDPDHNHKKVTRKNHRARIRAVYSDLETKHLNPHKR